MNQSPNPNTEAPKAEVPLTPSVWKKLIAEYQKPSLPKAIWQIVNTMVPYIGTWALIYLSLSVSYWLTAAFVVLLGMLTIRSFIIFHDCCHGSFFESQRACQIVGYLTGLLSFTPYGQWRWEHNVHHASSGHLDKRGTGDVWMMTIREYLEASRWKRFAYRMARNPIILFCVGPLYLFLIWQRFPNKDTSAKERHSAYWTNLGVAIMAIVMSWILGSFWTYALIMVGTMFVAGGAGVWMFYVQHQYEGVYWERADEWDYTAAALQGSSFYKLPKVLQWFTGNIGFHHIHHLSPRIANYNLERCHNENDIFQQVKPITLLSSLKAINYRFWDEDKQEMVGYKGLREFLRQQSQQAA